MKQYQNEKAIISLTSWKARINTVCKTLYSIVNKCPEFHIVLVLSEEEFPQKEKELPESLMLFVNCNLIEILWVYKNYKVYKKILFTIEKYKYLNIPIISADDDCLYICNYAEELYKKWEENKTNCVRYNMYNTNPSWEWTQGPSTLYSPCVFNCLTEILIDLKNGVNFGRRDDTTITKKIKQNNFHIVYVHRGHKFCFKFHDENGAMNNNRKNKDFESCYIQ